MASDSGYFSLSFGAYSLLLASLVLLGTPALFFWLADERILPWRDERAWIAAREELVPPSAVRAEFDTARVELERRCYELCPWYRVTIWGSGLIEFEGFRRTCAPGTHTARIDPRLAIDLILDLHVSRFRELWWEPDHSITDASTAIIRFNLLALSQFHEHYLGDRNAPRVLHDMERTIDEVAGSARWLPRREGMKWFCIAQPGTLTTLGDM
jgi:hypothetical protein